jgi:hypothetical protein
MEEQQYFVQIRDPADVRRGILGSSKQIIQILQRYERIRSLRVKKLEKIAKLRALNKEINLLVAKMKKTMPAADFRVKIGKDDKMGKKTKDSAKLDDLNSLESELRMIEEKIARMA